MKKTSTPQHYDSQRENEEFFIYIKTGFSILLLGERGTGKSRLVEELKKFQKKDAKFVSANCARFANDTMAEAELFGYEPDSFTGANKNGKNGLFQEADGGVLFLDEIHRLSHPVQAKLMRALQTDEKNKMHINRFGGFDDIEVEFKLIVATNKTIDELREILLPDFFDRIVQHVVEIPPLRNNRGKIETHWEKIWKQLKFEEPVPKDKVLINWLKEIPLYGNFRDLQKIAIHYHTYSLFDKENTIAKNAFEYTKNKFEKYCYSELSTNKNSINMKLDLTKTAKEIEKEFKFKLQEWAIKEYGDINAVAKKLNVTDRILRKWKTGK